MTFNDNQLASYADARQLRDWLNAQPQFAGRQILAGDDEHGIVSVPNVNMPWLPPTVQVPGIYVPSWEGGPHGDAVPHSGTPGTPDYKTFLHYRMSNGFSGANVGLIMDKFRKYPTSQQYVLDEIVKEYK